MCALCTFHFSLYFVQPSLCRNWFSNKQHITTIICKMFRLRCWHKNHRWLSICTLTLDNIKPFYQTHYQTVIVLQMLLVWCCLQDVLGTWQSFHRTRQWWQVDRWHLTVIPTPTPDCHRTSVVISVMLSTGCVGYLTVVPQNTAVMTGRPLTLYCDTNTSTRLSSYFSCY